MMDLRKLDALLAEHLFELGVAQRDCVIVHEQGMNNCWQTCIYGINSMPWGTYGGKKPIQLWVVPGGPGDYQEVEHYSTTYQGMGLVAKAMGEKGLILTLCTGKDFANAKFSTPLAELLGCPGWVHEKTAPTAVARAAGKILFPDALKELENG